MIVITSQENNPYQEKLVVELNKKNAEIAYMKEKKIKIKKEIQAIQKSKKWKLANKLPLTSSKQSQDTKLDKVKLDLEIANKENELLTTLSNLLSEKYLDKNELEHVMKDGARYADIMPFLDKVLTKKQVMNKELNNALFTVAHHYKKHPNKEIKDFIFKTILDHLHDEETPEFLVRKSDQLITSSFKGSLIRQTKKWNMDPLLPEVVLDNKRQAYKFIDSLSVKRPWLNERNFTMADLEIHPKTVIKPVDGAGSRGVYLLFDESKIQDVRRKQYVTNLTELQQHMAKDLDNGLVTTDQWLQEELITDEEHPAKDIKFYCFYGRVSLILEIERYPNITYCWWTNEGKRISTGRYDNELFQGQGVSEEEIRLAESISREIPAPFIRIDFLKTKNELVFGEFTPKPGNFDEFDEVTDQWLGEYFVDAEVRLNKDLLDRKSYPYYDKMMKFLQEEDNSRRHS